MKPWTLAAVVVAVALYAASLSNEFYHMTSPETLSWHVALRKVYSIFAFALVGYLARRALRECGAPDERARVVVTIAVYSALIEVGQYLAGSKEGLAWNVFDTLCGGLGGWLATLVPIRASAQRRS